MQSVQDLSLLLWCLMNIKCFAVWCSVSC